MNRPFCFFIPESTLDRLFENLPNPWFCTHLRRKNPTSSQIVERADSLE
jgi:hypothetical protein